MSGMELYQSLSDALNRNEAAIGDMRRHGREYAEAEASYRMELSSMILGLKAQGYPATLIRDVARGADGVAKAKERSMISESLFKAAQEECMLRKREADVIREQIAREYGGVQ